MPKVTQLTRGQVQCRTLIFRLQFGALAATPLHWPLRSSAQQSEGSHVFVSEAIVWRVVLSVAQRPAEVAVFKSHPGLTGD